VNWDLWLGVAPMREYAPCYHPFIWRDWQDFGGGALGDFGCHILDPVFTALGIKAPLTITAENSGVLLYINWADRDIEIVADRGIRARVAQHEWEAICKVIEQSFRAGQFEGGLLEGIRCITRLLAEHFPASSNNVDELGNRPVML
jgi:hypothetical protein